MTVPLSMAEWTTSQWGVFTAVLAAGALAALLAGPVARARVGVRAWRLHHPYPAPAARGRKHREMATPDEDQRLSVSPTGEVYWSADVAAHVAPGPGSLTSLRQVGPGSVAAVEPLVDDDVAAEVGAALDAALSAFRVAIEPAMRTARLWTLRGGETYAENALRVWHIMEITGEYPMVPVLDASSTMA